MLEHQNFFKEIKILALIFGHKSPDTDATGSPIIWQWYKNEILSDETEAVLLGKPNKEALFMLNYWNIYFPRIINDVGENEDVIIVDTNNPNELPDNIGNANIIEIIDHHLLHGGLSTSLPISLTIKPLASTATVMLELIQDKIPLMPKIIKGVALSCILSDTLEFRSPTTTKIDKQYALELAGDLGIDIPQYASEMFAAKSDMSSYTDTELLTVDSKFYEIGGKKLRISVLETTTPETILDRQIGLLKAMESFAQSEEIDQVLLFIVDILKEQSTLLIPNDFTRQIAEKSFSTPVAGKSVLLPGVVSRKKQIIPNLNF